MNRESLIKAYREKVALAKILLDKADLEGAKKARTDAANFKAQLEVLEEVEKMVEEMSPTQESKATMRPPLSGATSRQTMVDMTGVGVVASAPDNSDTPESNVFKAAYVTRFNDVPSTIKAILVDLHGADYEGAYWQQRIAFNKYLRHGDADLDREARRLLKQVVLTPAAVKSAIEQGVDQIDVLKATMVEAVDSLGGYIVPVDFNARVIERLMGMTVMRGRASVDTTSRDMVEYPVATGGDAQYTSAVRVTWVDEKPTAGTAETNLTFGMEAIPIHTVMAETPLSRNLVEDAAFNIEAYLTRKLAEAAGIDEDNKFLTGSGAGTPQGILPGGTNLLSLTEKNSGGASTVTWDGLIAATYGIDAQYRGNAVWLAEKATYEAIRKLKDANFGYFWQPFQFAGGGSGQPGGLMGYAPLEQESLPSIAANAFPIIFGDLAGYTIVDRIGMTVERYLDSNTARQNAIIYVMRRRLGGQVTEPWRFVVQKVAS